MCLSPFRASHEYVLQKKGSLEIKERFGKVKADSEGELLLPCGKCSECISKRAFDWATRCKHEISLHDENTFLTLTYDDENIKKINPLDFKSEFQKFMKRLRKKLKRKVRYIVSHEYGGKTGRPHHHAIIFGWEPPNQYHFMNSPSGEKLFRSPDLESLWTNGYSSIGEANEKTSYYIASYALKSNSIDTICPDTGEIVTLRDSMDSSKRPAIGKEYFLKNAKQLAHSNTLLPRYYQKLLERYFPDLLEVYENDTMLRQNKIRTSHQIYAKFVNTEKKKENEKKGLRCESDHIKNKYTKNYLRSGRDDSDKLIQKQKGEKL